MHDCKGSSLDLPTTTVKPIKAYFLIEQKEAHRQSWFLSDANFESYVIT